MFSIQFLFIYNGWIITIQHPAKNHPSYFHFKLLYILLPLLGFVGKIFHPAHHYLLQEFQEKTQGVNEENAFSNICDITCFRIFKKIQNLFDIMVT